VWLKDKHRAILECMAFEVNQIWNTANEETSLWCTVPIPGFGFIQNNISAFDLQKQLKGLKKQRGFILPAASVQETIAEQGRKRKQHKKDKLKWRTSGGSRRALGWIPFKKGSLKFKNGQCWFAGKSYGVWDSYGLSQYDFRSGSFSQDARGRWSLNIVVEVEIQPSRGRGQIGIDLGLKTTARCSDGICLERQDFYRKSEEKLGKAQRANK